jgi:GMP synthase (glutamine-hydrolysing)
MMRSGKMRSGAKLKILLLQARLPDDPMRAHEHRCFAEQCGLAPEQIICHNLATGCPSTTALSGIDAVMVGGAGDYYVSRGDLPEFDRVIEFFAEIVTRGFPMYASCFGFHCCTVALGGSVIHDPARMEVGTFEITLTAAGSADPLLGVMPQRFMAQEGHKDRVTELPTGLTNLAGSELGPMQAFRIPDQPIWATQFHPELTRATNLDRFHNYLAGYAAYMSAAQREAALAQFHESPETDRLLPRFLKLVFG